MDTQTVETTIQRLFNAPIIAAPPLNDICLGVQQLVYIPMFWRPYLGAMAFDLWEVCRAAQQGEPRPTIEHLAMMIGGQRSTILGRAACGKRPSQEGVLAMLLHEKIAWHTTTGRGRQKEHRIEVRPFLPILTPRQANTLPGRLQDYHELFLGSVRGFNLPTWRKRTEGSFVGG